MLWTIVRGVVRSERAEDEDDASRREFKKKRWKVRKIKPKLRLKYPRTRDGVKRGSPLLKG